MNANRLRRTALPVSLAGAATVALLAGAGFSSTVGARSGDDRAPQAAQSALAKGQTDKAIVLAEGLVAGNPREASYRALLAQAYLKAGRFESAVTTFNDAMKLGDNSARTALGLALASAASGRNREAVSVLEDWRDAIPTADLGLALALAGETSRGSALLADELRRGESTVKLRQNLAYAMALDGRWREARMIVEQDLPADRVDARLSDWAAKARPEDTKQRVAALINAPMRDDPGQPAQLALADSTPAEQLAAETSATKAAVAGELPAVAARPVESSAALASYSPVTAPVAAPVAETPRQDFAVAFAAEPATQPAAAQPLAAKPAKVAYKAPVRTGPARVSPVAKGGSHLVQLGSFSSPQGARRAWGIFAARNPSLKQFRMTITPAVVHGKNFWRVAAAGFNANGANGMCSSVKARGGVCFAYAARTGVPTRVGAPMMAAAKPKAAAPKVAMAKPVASRPTTIVRR